MRGPVRKVLGGGDASLRPKPASNSRNVGGADERATALPGPDFLLGEGIDGGRCGQGAELCRAEIETSAQRRFSLGQKAGQAAEDMPGQERRTRRNAKPLSQGDHGEAEHVQHQPDRRADFGGRGVAQIRHASRMRGGFTCRIRIWWGVVLIEVSGRFVGHYGGRLPGFRRRGGANLSL